MNFDSSYNTDYLVKSCFIFSDWFFNTKLSIDNTAFNILLNLFQKS